MLFFAKKKLRDIELILMKFPEISEKKEIPRSQYYFFLLTLHLVLPT
jgi:hypothetical protein